MWKLTLATDLVRVLFVCVLLVVPYSNADDGGTISAGPKKEMTPEVRGLVERLQSFYEKTADFRADFRQEYTYRAFKRTQVSTGKVIFRKPTTTSPAMMRWEYEKPSPKTFVLVGDRILAHDAEAKVVTIASISTSQLSVSVTFLFGVGKLVDEFSIVERTCERCAGRELELTPLVADVRFRQILFEVNEGSGQVLRSTVVDPDGSQNVIRFSHLEPNIGVEEAQFRLAVPPGTQVQDFRASARADGGR